VARCYTRAVKRPKNGAPSPSGGPDHPHAREADLDALIAKHLPGLTAFVRLRLGALIRENESCADIVQSACREVLVNADRFRFEGEKNFRHWLFTTALRKITDKQRYYAAAKRRPPRVEERARGRAATSVSTSNADLADCYRTAFTSPSEAAMRKEDVARLEAAFDALDPEDREVVIMARILGLAHEEIARETGSTPGAVRARLSRALVRLAARLRARGTGSGGAPRPRR
jgi:RNA polymerase sigma factor (sigma-70 family)